MIAEEPTAPAGPPGAGSEARHGEGSVPDTALTTLRGAGVEVDVRRLGRVVVGGCLLTVAVLAAVFFVVGIHKNAQITSLRRHGVVVDVTVSGCSGLLGGSGSNPVGYACRGTFPLGGHRYDEAIPGDTLYPPGARVRAVAVPGHPPLLSTVRAVRSEHASWRVFILPTSLAVVLVVAVGALGIRRRHLGGASAPRSWRASP